MPDPTPIYSLEIGASNQEIVIATVSTNGVLGTTTYVVQNSHVPVKVGGDQTTPDDVWDIRVFDNSTPLNALTNQYTILVNLSSSSCTAVSWKKVA
jgi:hypothetical protein